MHSSSVPSFDRNLHCPQVMPYHAMTHEIPKTTNFHEEPTMFSYKNISGLADPHEIGTYVVGYPTMTTNPNYLGQMAALKLASGSNAAGPSKAVYLQGTNGILYDHGHAAKLHTTSRGDGQVIRTETPLFTTTMHNSVTMVQDNKPMQTQATHGVQMVPSIRNHAEFVREDMETALERQLQHKSPHLVSGGSCSSGKCGGTGNGTFSSQFMKNTNQFF